MSRILIVEDEAELAEVLGDVLGAYGYDVLVAYNGKEGLQAALTGSPDLVLTDLMMPECDGAELLEALRANPSTRDTPVIMMSAVDQVAYAPFLRKPFEIDDLVELIEDTLP
jgi:CheY-like chemotaxis protein